jgi:hypothetical protein
MGMFVGQLHHFSLNPLLLQGFEQVPYHQGGITVFAGTAVKGDYFHVTPHHH